MKAEAKRRAVVDTHVWISAALVPTGVPAQVVARVLAHGVPVVTVQTVEELRSRLYKPTLDRYITLEQRQALLHDLEACALWAEVLPAIAQQTFSRAPNDDAVVHAALAGEAQWLITGDADLLVLAGSLPFTVLSPVQALAQLGFMV